MPQGYEWIFIVVLVVLLFGGSQLPKLAKNLGRAQREFKDGLSDGAKGDAATSSADEKSTASTDDK